MGTKSEWLPGKPAEILLADTEATPEIKLKRSFSQGLRHLAYVSFFFTETIVFGAHVSTLRISMCS